MEKQNLISVRISKISEDAISRMMQEMNQSVDGVRITKTELMSWVLVQFEKEYFKGSIESLQKAHFDPLAYLEAVVKKAKTERANGRALPDMAALLSPVVGKT